MTQVTRYNPNTPKCIIERDYLVSVSKDAKSMGQAFKAWLYQRKADRNFKKAGGKIIEI